MTLIESFSNYWSRADTLFFPLLGISKNKVFNPNSYLFWNEYSIENYHLILEFNHSENSYIQSFINLINKNTPILEIYEVHDRIIMIVDLSTYAEDVDKILKGKYSRISNEAKGYIKSFNKEYVNGEHVISQYLYAAINPKDACSAFNNKSPIEFVSEQLGLDLEIMQENGEVAGLYDRMSETLIVELSDILKIV